MNDLDYLVVLFYKNGIDYHITELYDDNNEMCGYAMWLNVGHIEFDLNSMLTNVVTY